MGYYAIKQRKDLKGKMSDVLGSFAICQLDGRKNLMNQLDDAREWAHKSLDRWERLRVFKTDNLMHDGVTLAYIENDKAY